MTVVLVTGPSRGIGRATALLLAERGADLGLLGRPSAALDDTAAQARSSGRRVELVHCDLTAADQIEAAAERALDTLGAPDAVVHNAGVIHRATIDETSTLAYDEQLAVNLRAPFLLTRALLPAMRSAGRGRIVYVSSISATLMAVAVLPGSVDTEMLAGSGFEPRMTAMDVATALAHYALDASIAHNGSVVEMFGV